MSLEFLPYASRLFCRAIEYSPNPNSNYLEQWNNTASGHEQYKPHKIVNNPQFDLWAF